MMDAVTIEFLKSLNVVPGHYSVDYFEQLYQRNIILWDRDAPFKELIETIEKYIKPCKMLDVGCGLGVDALWFAQKGFTVEAIDIAPSAIEKAKKEKVHTNLTFRQSDIMTDDQLDKYDLVLDVGCFHHLPKTGRIFAVEKAHSILNESGMWLSYLARDNANPMKPLIGLTREEINTMLTGYFNIIELSEVAIVNKNDLAPLNAWGMLVQKI